MYLLSPTTEYPPAERTADRKRPRYAYLDVLRGLLLVLMAINHVPSDLHPLTDHSLGYMSAAEGFVFLAGLMAGLVYTRKLLRKGVEEARQAAIKRAGTIYAYHLTAYLFIFVWVAGCRFFAGITPSVVPEQILAHPFLSLLAGPMLVYQPSLFDILPMYCGFILLIPTLLAVLERGNRLRLFLLSFATWTVANAILPQSPIQTGLINSGAFNIAAWQLLFVTGVIFGHAWAKGEKVLPESRWPVTAICLLLVPTLFLVRHAFLPSGISGSLLGWITNKNNLAPLRLVNSAAIFWLVYSFLGRFPNALTWKPLEFLGRHSISVFSFHVLVAYVIYTFPESFASDAAGRWLGTAVMLAGLFAAAGVHQLLHRPAETQGRASNWRSSASAENGF